MSLALAAGIKVGGALIGGMLDRRAQRAANKASTPQAQVKAWEKAGINPLFGLTSGAFVPPAAVSMGDSFATAGGAIGRGLELQHEDDLKKTALAQENEALKGALADMSRVRTPSAMSQYGGRILRSSDADDEETDGQAVDSFGNDRTTGMDLAGLRFSSDPSTSDVEIAENRYGDIMAAPFGLVAFGRDLGHSMGDAFTRTAVFDDMVKTGVRRRVDRREADIRNLNDQGSFMGYEAWKMQNGYPSNFSRN